MADRCRVGVIIPAHSCPCRQALKVAAECKQGDRLVIVANGFPRATACRDHLSHNPVVTWVERAEPLGPARARNLGTEVVAGAEALLFCDADDEVEDGWLTALADPLLNDSADVAGGPLRLVSNFRNEVLVAPAADYGYRQALFGGNVGVTHRAWTLLKGFNESLLCCEDTDLAWRSAGHGLRIEIVRDAIVRVALKSPIKEMAQRFRWGTSSVDLLLAHAVGLENLPSLRILFHDKKSSGFASVAILAALAQWSGQCARRLAATKRAARTGYSP
jgi:glycosyltransferase involved in cell wall biosynthesis